MLPYPFAFVVNLFSSLSVRNGFFSEFGTDATIDGKVLFEII